MKYRPLGKTGREVSEIGFGAWAIGADWGEEVSKTDAIDALNAAFETGVNFIDTADVYGAGRSEEIVGEAIKGREIFVATKMGRFGDWTDSEDSIARAAEASCKRLGVDALDLVQLHCIPTETLKAGRAFAHLESLKKKGLIRDYGVSVETIDEGRFCIQESGVAALQVIFNIFRQRVIHELLPEAERAGVGIIARVPLASGLLSGKYSSGHQFAESDHRRFNADGQCFNVGETFAGVPFEDGVRFAAEIGDYLEKDECQGTPAQLALRWILDFPQISTVIPGAKSVSQARENSVPSDLPPLSKSTHASLAELYSSSIGQRVRGVY